MFKFIEQVCTVSSRFSGASAIKQCIPLNESYLVRPTLIGLNPNERLYNKIEDVNLNVFNP